MYIVRRLKTPARPYRPETQIMETVADLVEEGAKLVRLAARTEDRTSLLKQLADVLVSLRSHFDYEGDPDWAGRSWDYRMTAQEMYEKSSVKPDESDHIQAAVRYHVGNALRKRVSAVELERAGLLRRSPKERISDQRDEMGRIVAAVEAATDKVDGPGRPLQLATAAQACLERLLDAPIHQLGDDARLSLEASLEDIEDLVRDAQRKLRRRATTAQPTALRKLKKAKGRANT